MALWLFRRKSAHKRPRSGAALSDSEGPAARPRPAGAVARAASKKKQRTEPNKLQRRPRAYSFSPGRHDSIRVDRPHGPGDAANREGPMAADVAWERMPTLHLKNHQQPTRRRSSKRRREDHEREAEIKAMSASMPTRATVDASAAGVITRRSSKRAKTSKTPAFAGHWDKPASNVSLPLYDSIHSSHSSDSECVSFKVSALDCLTPRPTLRYAAGSRWTPAAPGSQKKTLAEREVTIAEELLDSRKRIDDLADGLGASDLRELMERDNRRRERRRQRDQERMERRLARRAETQRRDEAEANKSGTPAPENLERGVLGRELVGLGIEPPSTVVTSSKKRASRPTPDPVSDMEAVQPKEPLEAFHRTETMPRGEERVVPKVHTVPPAEPDVPAPSPPHGFMLAGILRSKKSQSKSSLSSDKDKTVAEDDSARKGSEASSRVTRFSLASFLKWGGRKRRSSGPSSFSNTSREEMQVAASAQAEALAKLQGDDASPQGNYIASKPGPGLPKRTRSRFREDLPDYPLSPDSRVQSPESESTLPMVAEVRTPDTELHPTLPLPRDMSPYVAAPAEATRPRPVSNVGAGAVLPEAQQSISLASIDSEGSWLSGRVGSRRKWAMRESIARANRCELALESPTSSTHEDVGITDDDYLSQLAADQNSGGVMVAGRRSGDCRPSSDDDEPMQEGNVRWGAVGARPHVVQFHHYDRDTTRSHVGLLNMVASSGAESNQALHSLASVKNFDVENQLSTVNSEAI